jgi:hypothetical protein
MRALTFSHAHVQIGYQALMVNARLTRKLRTELESDFREPALPEATWKRIGFYVLQAQITGLWVTTLRGSTLSHRERSGLAVLGALTPLLDDWTDEQRLTTADILHRAQHGTGLVPQLYQRLFDEATPAFGQAFLLALAAQEASLEQLSKVPLANDRLRELSFQKGATAMIWYRHYFGNPLVEGEEEMFASLGYALQLTNDLFDVYKDREAGQQTLVTNARDIASVAFAFDEAVQQLKSKLFELPYPAHRLWRAWAQMSTVLSRGAVCLDQLRALQKKTGTFRAPDYTRAQLICDMETPGNVLAAWRHAWRWMRRP